MSSAERVKPELPDAAATGEAIAYHRRRLGLSQVEFAGIVGRSESWVSQVERGVRAIDRMSVLQAVADALSVSISELRGTEPDESASAADRSKAFEALRLSLTGHPAIAIVLGAEPEQLTKATLDRLREQHEAVWPMVHRSQYTELAPLLADLIPKLERATRATADARLLRGVRELLTDSYQAAAAMLAKLSETDAAWIAADRAAYTAEALSQPLAVSASLFRMAHVFLSLGHIAQAQTVAATAAAALEERASTLKSPEALSLRGAFHLVLAVAAARDNDREAASDHLAKARTIGALLAADRNDYGTEFGPTNVALHAVGVAVELGDAGQALDLARTIDSSQLSAERQSRYLIDLAQAHAMRRQIGEALACLERAEQLASEQTRDHPHARTVVRDLVQLSGSRPRQELRDLAERFGILP